jgi:hypothetical protein
LSVVGIAAELPPRSWITVVVLCDVPPLAMISAIAPPAIAPAMTGTSRPRDFMIWFSWSA